jgi:hypothetical protein
VELVSSVATIRIVLTTKNTKGTKGGADRSDLCCDEFRKIRLLLAVLAVLACLVPLPLAAQDDPNDTPLGAVARSLRQKTASPDVIENDNLSQVMDKVEGKHASGSALKLVMAGENQGFHVSAADVTCSLSFTANAIASLASQYAQMDLPPSDILKLTGAATVEGDADHGLYFQWNRLACERSRGCVDDCEKETAQGPIHLARNREHRP